MQDRLDALKDIIKDNSRPMEHRKQAQREFNSLMQQRRSTEAPAPATDNYRGQHTAPSRESGAPIHDLTKIYPADVYTHPHFYEDLSDPITSRSMAIAQGMRGRTKGTLTVFRAIPKDAPKGTRINPGDWVGIHRGYVQEHGHSALGGQFRVIQKTVPLRHIFTAGDSINEWGYDPSGETK